MRMFAVLLLLAGCSGTSAVPIIVQGRQAFSISCDGEFSSALDCNKKASEVCPSGYKVLQHEATNSSDFRDGAGFLSNIRMTRSLLVSCAA